MTTRDTVSTTVEAAAAFEQWYGEDWHGYDDRPDPSDLREPHDPTVDHCGGQGEILVSGDVRSDTYRTAPCPGCVSCLDAAG